MLHTTFIPLIYSQAMGGENPDWIGWEQSYNCGRDNGVFELVGRIAAWNKAILHFSASGGFIPENCGKSKVDRCPCTHIACLVSLPFPARYR